MCVVSIIYLLEAEVEAEERGRTTSVVFVVVVVVAVESVSPFWNNKAVGWWVLGRAWTVTLRSTTRVPLCDVCIYLCVWM
jgi:hypothetical protein